jgi:hypothetical protein
MPKHTSRRGGNGKPNWDRVTREHVERACAMVDSGEQVVPPGRAARSTFVIFNGHQYDAKFIRGLAYRLATGTELPYRGAYWGGKPTIKFFTRLKFETLHRPRKGLPQPPLARGKEITVSEMRVGLVMCCGEKLGHPSPAEELYQSALFKKASAYAKAHYEAWFILSAKYGLVAPTDVIEPYDCTLKKMRKAERCAWGHRVFDQIVERGLAEAHFFGHTGADYLDPLPPALKVERPLKGLGIGQRCGWYPKGE